MNITAKPGSTHRIHEQLQLKRNFTNTCEIILFLLHPLSFCYASVCENMSRDNPLRSSIIVVSRYVKLFVETDIRILAN